MTAIHFQICTHSTALRPESSSHWTLHWCTTFQHQSWAAQLWQTEDNHPCISVTRQKYNIKHNNKLTWTLWGSLFQCHHWTTRQRHFVDVAHQGFWWPWLHFNQFTGGGSHLVTVPWEDKTLQFIVGCSDSVSNQYSNSSIHQKNVVNALQVEKDL